MSALEPIWVERFNHDVAADTRVEAGILLKAWLSGVIVFLGLLIQRLFA